MAPLRDPRIDLTRQGLLTRSLQGQHEFTGLGNGCPGFIADTATPLTGLHKFAPAGVQALARRLT